MRKTLALFRAALRSNFGLSLLKHRLLVEKKDRWVVPLVLLGVGSLVPVILAYVSLLRYMVTALQPAGQETAVLTMAILAGQLLVLIFGFYYVLSAFYFSRDLQFLVSLPLRPSQVMASKFGVLLINEYLTTALIVVPAFAVFGALGSKGPGFWLLAVLVFLLLPVIPLALSGILIVGMMRLVNFSRKKDFFMLIGSLILLALALAFQTGLARTRDLEDVVALLTRPDGMIQVLGDRFPPSIWATRLLAEGFTAKGLGYLALFGGASVAVFLFLFWASDRLFYRGLIGLTEKAPGRRRLSRADLAARMSSGHGPVRAVFLREWRLMNRTPIFLLNGIMSVVLVPVILVLAVKTGGMSGPLAAFRLFGSTDGLTETLIAAAAFIVCGCLNGTASSTISREGRQFWISKVIPVDPGRQVFGKFLHSFLVAFLGTVAGSVAVVAMFRMSLGRLLPAVLLSLLGGAFLTAAGMAIDLSRPLLKWTNPQRAIKQNLNVLVAMAVDLGFLVVTGYLVKAARAAGIGSSFLLVLLLCVAAVLAAASLVFLMRFARRRYPLIEA